MNKFNLSIVIALTAFFGTVSTDRYRSHPHFDPIKIGGLFDDSSEETRKVFEYAVVHRNKQNDAVQLKPTSKNILYGNEFDAARIVCTMIENKVIGIIGPSSPESAVHVRSLCDTKEIPLIETTNDGSSKHTINLHPTPEGLGMVYLDMINAWDWNGFTIIYQDAPWLSMVEYILKNYNKPYTITLRQLDVTSNENYRAQLWRVKKSDDKNILLCSSIESLPEILKQAQQVGLLTNDHQFIITSLDMHTIDLEPFQYSGTNITGFRMVSPHDPFVQDTTEFFKQMYLKDRNREDKYHTSQTEEEDDSEMVPEGLTAEMILLQTALTYDAVYLFHKVMAQHVNMSVEGVKCDNSESIFVNGTSIFNSMKTFPPFKGLSGDIQVDQHGNRENFHLEILELASEGLKQIGTWNSTMKIQTIKGKLAEAIDNDPNSVKNKTLTVLIAIQNPYAMRKENIVALEGNDQYEGFAVELIEKLASVLEFSYIFDIEPKVGQASDPTRNNSKWSGMIGRLMDDTAHLAICDLTITAEREAVIDFTMPFMTLGIAILYEKAKPEDPKMFSFLDPFDPNVWGCLFGSFFMVSLSLFIMGRLSPAEWDNPYPCIEEPEVLINQFSFKNAMWFTIGALLQQGSEIAPKAPSTRIVASMWWFFTLIMVSSYTANLAAFLTIENPRSLVNGVEDLIAGKAPYGAKRIGSTANFFRDSTNPNYTMMYDEMFKQKNLLEENNDGLKRAEGKKFAFFMESSTIEYMVQRHCDVQQVGNLLDEKGYGVGMKKNSPYRGALSEAILQLQESGEISRMKTKWWKEKRGGGKCASVSTDPNKPLDMRNVGGVFVVVTGGCILALIMGIFQWLVNIRKISKTVNVSFAEVFKEELRFFRKFKTHVKTVAMRKNSTQRNSVNESSSRSRSTGNVNNDSIGFRMSLKNLHKIARDDEAFDKI